MCIFDEAGTEYILRERCLSCNYEHVFDDMFSDKVPTDHGSFISK